MRQPQNPIQLATRRIAAMLVSAAALACAAPPAAHGAEGFEPYVDLHAVSYRPPAAPRAPQVVELTFDVSLDLPKGAKITFALEFRAAPIATVDYVLETEVRKNLSLAWKPRSRLPTGKYFLRVRMPIDRQTPTVRRLIEGRPERFPPDREPWAVYYPEPRDTLRVGGPEEEKAEREEISRIYSGFIDALIANMGEFVDAMEQLERGERWVANGAVDLKKVETFVARWKKEQGELQEEILRFRTKEPGLYQKTMTAYLNLIELGKMVSKRSWNLQQDTLEGRGVTEIINPAAHPCFDRNYRYVVDARSLNSRLEKIRSLLQPEQAREAEGVRAAVESEAPDDEEGGAGS